MSQKCIKIESPRLGFEPTQKGCNTFQVKRLNHSAITGYETVSLFEYDFCNARNDLPLFKR